MRTIGVAGVLALQGCVAAIPPPAGLGGRAAVSAAAGSDVAVSAAIGHEVAASAGIVERLGRSAAVEVRGQVTDASVAADPGLWLRAPLGDEERDWVAARIGGVAGTGTLGPELAFDNPYVGPTLHLQYALRYGGAEENPGIFAVTTGVEYEISLLHDFQTDLGQGETTVARLNAVWVPLDLRVEAPIGPRGAVTASVGGSWYAPVALAGAILPHASLGLRFGLDGG